MDIKNKVVIVTGASGGIGLATTKLLASKGAKVALVARSKDKLETIAKELADSIFVVADMTIEKDIINMVAEIKNHYSRIDVLINNAGQGYDASVEKTNLDNFKKIYDLNLIGPMVAMQQVIPVMKEQKSGVIINISSATALMFLPYMGAYSSLKRALVGISLTAREELKSDNISVGVVYPYITETDFEKNSIKETVGINNFQMPKGDSPELVAEKIIEAIESEAAEVFVRDQSSFLKR